MQVKAFAERIGADFYAGVPDSQIKALCDYLMRQYGIDPKHHMIAANEGNAVGLAAGYHLATGKVPVVYMQNSGLGNVINPMASLMSPEVYAMPCLYIVGWRGEPGVHDEPQHVYQGKVTLKLLEDMDIAAFVLSKETTEQELRDWTAHFVGLFEQGKSTAIVVRKGALENDAPLAYTNHFMITREEAIRRVVAAAGNDPIISTTGKASRELFEIRQANGQGHEHDFLTVGSMGHSSSIALALALQKPEKRIWCIDGDGAALMHMGAMALIGTNTPANLVHIIINNAAHETVGGMPTVMGNVDLPAAARALGYPCTISVSTQQELERGLETAKSAATLTMLECKCALGARPDLGRPTIPAVDNKRHFMAAL